MNRETCQRARHAAPRYASPRIDGAQVAVVAGPPSEEIHADAYGRVKLRFQRDRHARRDGIDTGWMRVSQP